MAREALENNQLENVVGGVFQFYKNGTRCKVQGGKYQCDPDGQFQLITLINAHPDLNEADILDLALSRGILRPL